ncbi:sulfotransferase [Thalassoroseus pseudoceratinae]|uniref:sulfotransferase n=1 Tax=Thalassoroseus pseudoceratinae TaxID=2713176 RepID=UPI0036F36D3A
MLRFPGKEYLRNTFLDRVRKRLECVFVLSTGRVGTESLTNLLNLSHRIHACHEPRPRMRSETKLAYQNPSMSSLFVKDYLNHRYFRRPDTSPMKSCVKQDLIYVETSNRLTYLAPALAQFFPKSKFIFLHRDPPAVIRSIMRRGYYQGHEWDDYRIQPRTNDPFSPKWDIFDEFQKCCWYWRAVNEFCIECINTIEESRTFNLRSSALFAQDVDSIGRLFRWLKVAPPSDTSVLDATSVSYNAQNQGAFPEWEDWSQEQRTTMLSIVAPINEMLGYRYQTDDFGTP